jgi:hypothetical protein
VRELLWLVWGEKNKEEDKAASIIRLEPAKKFVCKLVLEWNIGLQF